MPKSIIRIALCVKGTNIEQTIMLFVRTCIGPSYMAGLVLNGNISKKNVINIKIETEQPNVPEFSYGNIFL